MLIVENYAGIIVALYSMHIKEYPTLHFTSIAI